MTLNNEPGCRIMSENELTRVRAGTLRGLGGLRLLSLNHNKISCLESDGFKHLNQLETLYVISSLTSCSQWRRCIRNLFTH